MVNLYKKLAHDFEKCFCLYMYIGKVYLILRLLTKISFQRQKV